MKALNGKLNGGVKPNQFENSSKAWSEEFDFDKVNYFRIENVDKTYKKLYTQEQLTKALKDEDKFLSDLKAASGDKTKNIFVSEKLDYLKRLTIYHDENTKKPV